MGLANWFATFCDNLKVQNTATISQRYKAITKRLNKSYRGNESEISNSLYVGSYGRNTAVNGFSDLDMIYSLPWSIFKRYDEYIGNGQSALLQAVKTEVNKTYSTSSTIADGQVIVIPFTTGPTFELVPAFEFNSGSFYYPNTNNGGSWKTTNPRAEISAIRTRQNITDNNLINLCRMMRAWKNNWSVPIGGLLIDTLAYQFALTNPNANKSFIYYDWIVRDFFKFMADQDSEQAYWKAPGSGSYVYGKGLFQYKAKRCYNLALEAISHEMATPKREWSAKQKWREIFGTTFPQ